MRTRRISHRTLFYMREYGPHAHVASNIMKESVKVLFLASAISSLGGMGLQLVETKFITIIPLLVLLPALNDMIGDFGSVVGSKFSVALFRGFIGEKWWKSRFLNELFFAVLAIAVISSMYVGLLAWAIAVLQGTAFSYLLLSRTLQVSLLATVLLTVIIFAISIIGGLAIFRKKEDPNNFLIPMTTSIADFGSMILLAVLVAYFF